MHSHWVQNCLISTPLTHKPNSIFGTLNTIHIVVKLPTREKKPYIHRRANRRKNSNLFMVQYILRQSMCINECKLFDWANVSGYDSGNNIFSFNETHIMPWQYWQFENKKYETKSMFAYCERGCENGGRRKEWEGGNASSMVKKWRFCYTLRNIRSPSPLGHTYDYEQDFEIPTNIEKSSPYTEIYSATNSSETILFCAFFI